MKKKEITSDLLIKAAIELFTEHGVENTSLAMIAKKAGITKPSIYYHFDSKDALLERVFEECAEMYPFEDFIKISKLNEENFAQMLFDGGIKAFPKEEDHARVKLHMELSSIAQRNEKYRKYSLANEKKFIDGLEKTLEKGVEFGLISPENTKIKAKMLMISLDGIGIYRLMHTTVSEQESVAVWKEIVNSILLKGKLQ